MVKSKDPARQLQGAISKAKGKRFEERIDASFSNYCEKGFADIEKTPEPMRVIKRLESGKFIAVFEKKAQPDYKGLIKGGREILLEAKFTDSDQMDQRRVKSEQAKYMERHQRLGARCFVIVGFGSGKVYRIPWDIWKGMKEHFGRKYVTEADLDKYQVPTARNGALLLLG